MIKNKILSDTLFITIGQISFFAAWFIFKSKLAKTFSVETFGEFNLWLSIVNYLIVFSGIGLGNSLIYFSNKNNYLITDLAKTNIALYSGFALIASVIQFFFFQISIYNSLALLTVFVSLLIGVIESKLSVEGHFYKISIANFFKAILIAITSILITSSFKFEDIILVYFLILLISLLFFITFFKIGINWLKKFKFISFKKYYLYGTKSVALNLMGQTLYVSDIFLLSYLQGSRSVGFYTAAAAISRIVWFFTDSLGKVIFPLYVKGNEVKKITLFSILISLALLVVFLICYLLFGSFFINTFFGDKYLEINFSIIVLTIGGAGMITYKIISRENASINLWRPMYVVLILSIATNLILNYILIPIYDYNGAAVASFVSYFICGFLILIIRK